jgi:hypothetical protein
MVEAETSSIEDSNINSSHLPQNLSSIAQDCKQPFQERFYRTVTLRKTPWVCLSFIMKRLFRKKNGPPHNATHNLRIDPETNPANAEVIVPVDEPGAPEAAIQPLDQGLEQRLAAFIPRLGAETIRLLTSVPLADPQPQTRFTLGGIRRPFKCGGDRGDTYGNPELRRVCFDDNGKKVWLSIEIIRQI